LELISSNATNARPAQRRKAKINPKIKIYVCSILEL
jgi:hypothetical protein